VDVGPIWVRLLGLPFHFWTEDIFKRIGNALGNYLTYDASFLTSGRMAYARILVHTNLSDSVLEHINIQWRNITRRQILDYEGIPFRCRRCHRVGLVFKDCPLNGGSSRKDPRQEPLTREGFGQVEQPQPSEELPWHTVSPVRRFESHLVPLATTAPPAKSSQKKRGRPPLRPPPPSSDPAWSASGDSFDLGSETQQLMAFPKKLRSGSQAL